MTEKLSWSIILLMEKEMIFESKNSARRLPLSFSLAERERRYARVRQHMAELGLDCLLAPAADVGEPQAHSRYLSQIGGVQGGAWVVFPACGEVTAIVSAEREARMWLEHLLWPRDIRWGSFSELVSARVEELGLKRGRIGVADWLISITGPRELSPTKPGGESRQPCLARTSCRRITFWNCRV
ncbi:MAG: aminopeptidase P family N-terminal domain-containing protein [Deltaproteobacteria bacterium]|nr:aminopeptidase P family N-terminal domain-containing protein [Deltaproteobacteria bacterium]